MFELDLAYLGVMSLNSSCLVSFDAIRELPTHLDASGRRVTDGNVEEDNRARDARRRVERGRHGRWRKSNVDKGASAHEVTSAWWR